MDLICISLMTNSGDHIFMYLFLPYIYFFSKVNLLSIFLSVNLIFSFSNILLYGPFAPVKLSA